MYAITFLPRKLPQRALGDVNIFQEYGLNLSHRKKTLAKGMRTIKKSKKHKLLIVNGSDDRGHGVC